MLANRVRIGVSTEPKFIVEPGSIEAFHYGKVGHPGTGNQDSPRYVANYDGVARFFVSQEDTVYGHTLCILKNGEEVVCRRTTQIIKDVEFKKGDVLQGRVRMVMATDGVFMFWANVKEKPKDKKLFN